MPWQGKFIAGGYAVPTAQEIAAQLAHFIDGKYLTVTKYERECQAGYWNANNEHGELAKLDLSSRVIAILQGNAAS